jgi:hypothetical protein
MANKISDLKYAFHTLYSLTSLNGTLLLLRELFQGYHVRLAYLKSMENWLQMIMLGCAAAYMVTLFTNTHLECNLFPSNPFKTWLPNLNTHACHQTLKVKLQLRSLFSILSIAYSMQAPHFGAIAILLAWIELTLLMGRFSSIGIYVYMSVHVTKMLITFFLFYATVLGRVLFTSFMCFM